VDQGAEAVPSVEHTCAHTVHPVSHLLYYICHKRLTLHPIVRSQLFDHSLLLTWSLLRLRRYRLEYYYRPCERSPILADPSQLHRQHHMHHLYLSSQEYQPSVQHQKRDDPNIFPLVPVHTGDNRGIHP
jgi:hypothetical protein